uniref:hypothetical protein n=1 Tax=Acetatifactor sp. TaxID=1872090 RepID=UPI00405700E4
MIGKFATSKAGHDQNTVYVIVAEEGENVFLCDGKYKTLLKPKKKRKKHIQIIHQTVGEEVLLKLRNHEKIMDEQIKFEIKLLKQNHKN